MREFRFGGHNFRRPGRQHPEVQGQELDMIPFTQNTVKTLITSVGIKMQGIAVGEIVSPDATYTVAIIQPAEQRKLGGKIMSINLVPSDPDSTSVDYELRKPHRYSRIQVIKTTGAAEQLFPDTSGEEDSQPTSNLAIRAVEVFDVSQQDQKDLSEMTGLPVVSEGEIRRVTASINSGRFSRPR